MRVTVASTNPPATTVDAVRLKLARLTGAGVIVRRAVAVFPQYPPVAEIVADPVVKAELVGTVNLAVLAPEGTVMLGGTVATFVSDEERAMTTPAEGAFPISETVPVDGEPPTRLNGLRDTDERPAGSTVKEAVRVTPAYVAEIVTAVEDATPVVVIEKYAREAPAGTVTLGGVDATVGFELESETVMPPAPVESDTQPVSVTPPFTTIGDTVTEVRVDGRGVTVRRAFCKKP